MAKPSTPDPARAPRGFAHWCAIVAFGVLLGVAIWYATWGWNLDKEAIGESGRTALVTGVILSMLLGGGLMALLFWSHRKGYDR
jgi:TRAP-type C4-dicarboxylate transport system permease small subunit